jgi:TonB family protein
MGTFWMTAGAVGLALAGSAATTAEPTPPVGNLKGLVTSGDYPDEALNLGHQGSVGMLLTIGTDGRVSDCKVALSSGSQYLDATSCAIMVERARLVPATDAQGKPTVGMFQQRITWRINLDDPNMRKNLMRAKWRGCVLNQAAALAMEPGPALPIANRAVDACRSAETAYRLALRDGFTVIDVPATVRGFRRQYRDAAISVIDHARKPRQ